MPAGRKFNLWLGIALVILCFFVVFVVYPLILILYKSVIDAESSRLTLDYFTKFFARKYYWSTLVNSFYVTVCSAHCLRYWPAHGLCAAQRQDTGQ
ncbi:MAG: hypothetical protein LUC29_03565 [Acidaminococcaceae bacterium]|nr:hypothetical protein [Acidaminococcaceae bacterium]